LLNRTEESVDRLLISAFAIAPCLAVGNRLDRHGRRPCFRDSLYRH
jgi:hypothetical protein